ncbi:MAG: hydantoinase/oxoprolinase family protein [Alphaproteobacteria bacterium]
MAPPTRNATSTDRSGVGGPDAAAVAHLDAGAGFRVGPASAGAFPGPAAYGRGGTEPTVTDAHVVLGRLDPENFLGGAMSLDVAASKAVIDDLAARLNLAPDEAAAGVLAIANANMANAIHTRTVQKGLDPREFSLVAFGGAGPLHGAEVARILGVPEVIVPPYPGITSAVGLLTTDLKYDAIRTAFQTSTALDLPAIAAAFDDRHSSLDAQLAEDGVAAEDRVFERSGDLRYVGQGYELRAPFPAGPLDDAAVRTAFQAFAAAHRDEYGHDFPDSPIEIVNLRLTAVGRTPRMADPATAAASGPPTPLRSVEVAFRVGGAIRRFETPVYRRADIGACETLAGPAIVVQTDTTTVAPPGSTVTADTAGNLVIRLEQDA